MDIIQSLFLYYSSLSHLHYVKYKEGARFARSVIVNCLKHHLMHQSSYSPDLYILGPSLYAILLNAKFYTVEIFIIGHDAACVARPLYTS